jgi:hypothetical protein
MELYYFVNSTKDETTGESIPSVVAILADSDDEAARIATATQQTVPMTADFGEVSKAKATRWPPAQMTAADAHGHDAAAKLSAWILPLPRLDWKQKQKQEQPPAEEIAEKAKA